MAACRDLCKGHNLRKKTEAVTNSAPFQRVLELMLKLCTLGGTQRANCPGLRHTAYATRRKDSYTSGWELGGELDVTGHVDEEHWVFVMVLLLLVW